MDQAFWQNLASILTAVNVILITVVGFFTRRAANKIETKIDENTNVTVEGQREAKHAIIQTAEITKSTTSKAVSQGEKIAESVDTIKKSLNGGPNGLSTMNERVTSLEKRMDAFMLGQIDIVRSIDHLTTIIQRKQLD